jgi:hypothetical protein
VGDANGPEPPDDSVPRRATAIAANAMMRRATRRTWPLARPPSGRGTDLGSAERGRSTRTGVVEGIGRCERRPAPPAPPAPPARPAPIAIKAPPPIARLSIAAIYVAQVGWASARHSRRCLSSNSGTGGTSAAHSCSRTGNPARHVRPSVARNGQRDTGVGASRPGIRIPGTGTRARRGERGGVGSRAGEPLGSGPSLVIEEKSSPAAVAARPARPGNRTPPREDRTSPTKPARESQNPGDDLFSRKAALSVSSALESLTAVFGMGTGVASPPESPGFCGLDRFGSARRTTLGSFAVAIVRRTSII